MNRHNFIKLISLIVITAFAWQDLALLRQGFVGQAPIPPTKWDGVLRPRAAGDRDDYTSAGLARAIPSMDKAGIDGVIDGVQLERHLLLVRYLNDAIASCGGLARASPQERYALFKLLQNRNVIVATAGEITCVSPGSRRYLMQLTQEAADLGADRYYFSRVATAVFSGMVEDGTFADFCEEVQNGNFRPLPGAANVVLVDCPVDLKAVSMGLYRIASFLNLFGLQAHVVNVAEADTDITAGLPFYPHIIGKRFLTTTYQEDVDSMHQFEEVYPDSLYVAGGHEAAISDRVFTLAPRLSAAVMSWGEFAMLDMVVNLSPEGNTIPAAQRERFLEGIDGIRLKGREILRRKPFSPMGFKVISQAYNPKLIRDSGVEIQCVDIHGISHCSQGCIFCMADALFTDSAEHRQRFLHIEPGDFAVLARRIRQYLPGVTWINLSDENFFMNKARAKRFFDMVEKEELHRHFRFSCEARLDSLARLDEDFLRRIAGLGVACITVGLESPLEKIVRSLGKGESMYKYMPQYLEILRRAKKSGIPIVAASIILHTPEENIHDTLQIIEKVVEMVADNDIATNVTTELSVFPSTPLWHMYEASTASTEAGPKLGIVIRRIYAKDPNGADIDIPVKVLPKDPEVSLLIEHRYGPARSQRIQPASLNIYEAMSSYIGDMVQDEIVQDSLMASLDSFYVMHVTLLYLRELLPQHAPQAQQIMSTLVQKRDRWFERAIKARAIPEGATLQIQNRIEKQLQHTI